MGVLNLNAWTGIKGLQDLVEETEDNAYPDKNKDLMLCFDIHEDKEKDQWSTLKTMKLNEVIIHE